jgi:circadian clock protein KaiC
MERLATGIAGLDEMLAGGFFPESANLVEGAPGTGKTTLGMQFIYSGIDDHDEPGLILTFEEFPHQYYRDAAAFGWDLRALEAQGKLRVIMTSPEVTQADLKQVGGMLEKQVDEIGARRLLVDSISHFERISRDRLELRDTVFEFINGIKRMGLTAVLTRESRALLGGDPNVGQDMAFVADSYILLRYVEIASEMRKALIVLKLRGSNHAKDIHQYEITDQGVVVQAKFEGQQGIMSGNPTPRMAEAFGEAFGKPRK